MIPEDRPQAKVEALFLAGKRSRLRPHEQSMEEWENLERQRDDDIEMMVTPELIQEAVIGQVSPSIELKNLMDTVIAVKQRKPPVAQASGSGANPQGPPTRLGPQPAPQQAPQTQASQVKRSAQRTYTEDEVASMLAEARGGLEAVQVDPLEARRQALLR